MSNDTTLITEPSTEPTEPTAPNDPTAPTAAEVVLDAPPAPAESTGATSTPPPAPPAPPPAPNLTPAELEALQAKAGKADEHWDRYLRTVADLENFKKRAARERQEAMRLANESLLGKLVSVLDSFDMALAAPGEASAASLDSFRAGVSLISGQLRAVLTEAGLEEIDATGQPFNPNVHEAVAQLESADVPEGHVLKQLRKGYKYRERLVRPASVVVAKAPAAAA